jgi:hypothetical protein
VDINPRVLFELRPLYYIPRHEAPGTPPSTACKLCGAAKFQMRFFYTERTDDVRFMAEVAGAVGYDGAAYAVYYLCNRPPPPDTGDANVH